jgi:hypothetical protein
MPRGHLASGIPAAFIQWLLCAMGIAALPLLGAGALADTTAVPALYATKSEAENAARKHFNCTGVHPMGHQWMPCAKHGQASGSAHSQH